MLEKDGHSAELASPRGGDQIYHLMFLLVWTLSSVALFWRAMTDQNFGGDTAGYVLPIHNWLNGFGYVRIPATHVETHIPPGLGLLALPVYALVKDIVLSTNLLPPLAYVMTLLLVYWRSLRLFAPPHALLAVLFLAFLPGYMLISRSALSDGPFTLFLVAAFFTLLDLLLSRRTKWSTSIAWSLLTGYGSLIRPEMMFIGTAGFALWAGRIWLSQRRDVGLSGRAEIGMFAVSLGLASLPILSYAFFLKSTLGFFTLTGKAGPNIPWMVAQGMGYTPASRPELQGMDGLLRFLLVDNLQAFLTNIAKNYWTLFNKAVTNLSGPLKLFLGLFLIVSLFSWRQALNLGAWTRTHIAISLVLAACSLPLLPSSLLFVYDRLIQPYQVVLLIVLAWSVLGLLAKLSAVLSRPLNPGPVLLLSAGLLFTSNFRSYHEFFAFPLPHYGLKAAGEWLHANLPDLKPYQVAVAGRGTPVYIEMIGRRPTTEPGMVEHVGENQSAEQVIDLLRRGPARYLVLAAIHIESFPNLKPIWLKPALAPSLGLQSVVFDPERRFQIYLLKDSAAAK